MNKHTKDKQRKEDRKKAYNLKRRTFKGITFDSFLEADVARYLSSCGIKWERNTEKFPCIVDTKLKFYLPDFSLDLNGISVLLETKGVWHTDAKRIKTLEAVRQNNLNWIIIYQKEFRENKHILKERIDEFNS